MEETKKKRGFGSMSPERQKEIASLGGKAAHAKHKGRRSTTEEARAAGIKGAEKLVAERGKDYFSVIGKLGGKASNEARIRRRQGEDRIS